MLSSRVKLHTSEMGGMNTAQIGTSQIGTSSQARFRPALSLVPLDLDNRVLRQALHENLVSFPSQVPVFERQSRPDLQKKIVVLYFVRGWTMDDIAKRYGLGRQRMGQILTTWRIRAVKEGYIQPIEPDHAFFKRVERVDPFSDIPLQDNSSLRAVPGRIFAPMPAAPESVEPGWAMPKSIEVRRSNLAEELDAIVGILNNQLRLCSQSLNGNIDSCEQLLARAQTLCAQLEAQVSASHGEDNWSPAAVISAAKELFQRFQKHAMERSRRSPIALVASSRGMPPRMSRRIPVKV
jgi:hypothetical protein